jgi:hypothetical protein
MIIDLKRLQKRHADRHAGRKTSATPAPEAPPAPEAEKLTMTNTKTELTDAAVAAGVDVQSGWTKAQILAALYPDG